MPPHPQQERIRNLEFMVFGNHGTVQLKASFNISIITINDKYVYYSGIKPLPLGLLSQIIFYLDFLVKNKVKSLNYLSWKGTLKIILLPTPLL